MAPSLESQRDIHWAFQTSKPVSDTINYLQQLPNPWADLAPRESTSSACFQLEALPNELIFMIATFLPPESRAALALTSHHLKALLGPRALRFDRTGDSDRDAHNDRYARWNFLRALERDGLDDSRVACPDCLMLHLPDRACSRPRQEGCFPGNTSMHLPICFHHNRVSAFARQSSRCQQDPEACTRLLNNLGMASTTWALHHPHFRTVHHVVSRFVNGNLLVRSQLAIAPLITGRMTPDSYLALSEALSTDNSLRPCQHHTWQALLASMAWTVTRTAQEQHASNPNPATSGGDADPPEPPQNRNQNRNWKKYQCRDHYWFFAFGRFESLGLMLFFPSASPFNPSAPEISSCPHCATDFFITVREIPGVRGRVILATTWKDLGGPRSSKTLPDGDPLYFGLERLEERWKWDSHRQEPAEEEEGYDRTCMGQLTGRTAWNCETQAGNFARAFEEMARTGLDAEGVAVDPVVVEALVKTGEGDEAGWRIT